MTGCCCQIALPELPCVDGNRIECTNHTGASRAQFELYSQSRTAERVAISSRGHSCEVPTGSEIVRLSGLALPGDRAAADHEVMQIILPRLGLFRMLLRR